MACTMVGDDMICRVGVLGYSATLQVEHLNEIWRTMFFDTQLVVSIGPFFLNPL